MGQFANYYLFFLKHPHKKHGCNVKSSICCFSNQYFLGLALRFEKDSIFDEIRI